VLLTGSSAARVGVHVIAIVATGASDAPVWDARGWPKAPVRRDADQLEPRHAFVANSIVSSGTP
jgi:hypothetical protein